MTEFVLRESIWGTGGVDPKLLIKKFQWKSEKRKQINSLYPDTEYIIVMLTPEEVVNLLTSTECDVMFIVHHSMGGKKLLCIDGPGKAFRQR